MNTRTMLILYFLFMNLLGLSAMVLDKILAMERRCSIIGMFVFRNKNRKFKFRYGLPLILILQITAWLALHIGTSKIVFL